MGVTDSSRSFKLRFNLVTKECQENKMSYQDLLITRKGYRLSKEDEGFIRAIKCSNQTGLINISGVDIKRDRAIPFLSLHN